MGHDDPKTLNVRWIQAFNERDWEAEAAFRSADYQAHMSGMGGPLDGEGWSAFLLGFTTAFPDVQIAVDNAIAERDTVASRWTMTGTHKGPFQGIPASGKAFAMTGIDFSRVADGRIVEHWAQFDLMAVMQQIGALPAPA